MQRIIDTIVLDAMEQKANEAILRLNSKLESDMILSEEEVGVLAMYVGVSEMVLLIREHLQSPVPLIQDAFICGMNHGGGIEDAVDLQTYLQQQGYDRY